MPGELSNSQRALKLSLSPRPSLDDDDDDDDDDYDDDYDDYGDYDDDGNNDIYNDALLYHNHEKIRNIDKCVAN